MNRDRRVMAALYAEDGTEAAWLIAETPLEALERIHAAERAGPDEFVELTLANPERKDDPDLPRWNGRPVYVRASRIVTIGPPLDTRDDD